MIPEVKKRVEKYAKDKHLSEIEAEDIYNAKVEVKNLFSIPFNLNYEKHLGPVTSVCASPFNRRIFLSCSNDGSVRMFDMQNHRSINEYEPSGKNEYIYDV
jgi:WD40 repeat protein